MRRDRTCNRLGEYSIRGTSPRAHDVVGLGANLDAMHGKRMTADTDRTNKQGENKSLERICRGQ